MYTQHDTFQLHYLDELESKRPPLIDYRPRKEKALLVDLIMHNPTMKPTKIFQLYGLKQALTIMNLRELRTLMARYNPRTWAQLMKDATAVNLPKVPSPFGEIRSQLMEFKAVKNI